MMGTFAIWEAQHVSDVVVKIDLTSSILKRYDVCAGTRIGMSFILKFENVADSRRPFRTLGDPLTVVPLAA
jgi:hypothetical protein